MTRAPAYSSGSGGPRLTSSLTSAIRAALSGKRLAASLAERMPGETGTQFKVWVDHLVVSAGRGLAGRLSELGYVRQVSPYAVGAPLFAHAGGIFPPIALKPAAAGGSGGSELQVSEVAIKVESVADFSRAHDLGLEIAGYPMGPYRVGAGGRRVDVPGRRRAPGLSSDSSRFPAIWPAKGV